MQRTLSLIFLIGMLGCSSQTPYLAPQAPGEPVMAHPTLPFAPDPTPYETEAWAQYQRRDYVRALRLAYRAVDMAPADPRPVFLAAMIYDQGFDRPDLALVEYDRMFKFISYYPTLAPLRPRLYHLYRVAQQRAALATLSSKQPSPLSTKPLTVFPFRTWKHNKESAALALGFTDLILFNLESALGAENIAPLQLHLLNRAFEQGFPDQSASDFARWSGAAHTLTGDIVQQDDHRIRVKAKLLDVSGTVVHTFGPIETTRQDLLTIVHPLLDLVFEHLNLPVSTSPTPALPSPLALSLHAQGLDAYLSGDIATAKQMEDGAMNLAPQSPLIQRWHDWITLDIQGAQAATTLTAIYKKLVVQPDPRAAAQRRLNATQNVIVPATGLEGEESLSPYKPPQIETVP